MGSLPVWLPALIRRLVRQKLAWRQQGEEFGWRLSCEAVSAKKESSHCEIAIHGQPASIAHMRLRVRKLVGGGGSLWATISQGLIGRSCKPLTISPVFWRGLGPALLGAIVPGPVE